MQMIRLIVGGTLIVSFLIVAGLVSQSLMRPVAQRENPAESGAAVPVTLPTAPTTLAPTVTATIPPPPSPPTSDPPITSGTGQIGSQAIMPHVVSAVPGQPTFTEEDVRTSIAANGLDLIRVRAEGPYQIEQVMFLSYAEARTQAGIYVGVPDDRPLCLVTVRGTFTLTGPPVPGKGPTIQTFTTMTLIFDGITGNRLGERGQP